MAKIMRKSLRVYLKVDGYKIREYGLFMSLNHPYVKASPDTIVDNSAVAPTVVGMKLLSLDHTSSI